MDTSPCQTAVGPRAGSLAEAHAVDAQLVHVGARRDDLTPGTHAKGIARALLPLIPSAAAAVPLLFILLALLTLLDALLRVTLLVSGIGSIFVSVALLSSSSSGAHTLVRQSVVSHGQRSFPSSGEIRQVSAILQLVQQRLSVREHTGTAQLSVCVSL